jgi:hypothetical protein
LNDNDTLIRLIQDLRNNSQDDTDPSNVVIQIFQTPFEQIAFGESVTLTKMSGQPVWGGQGVSPNFNWNQGGSYLPSMEVLTCLALI